MTYHTLVGFLSRVDPHVNEQFVAGIEGFVAANAAGPETSKVFAFPLIDVHFLNVPDKLLLLLIRSTAVNPTTHLLVAKHSRSYVFALRSSVGPRRASRGCFKSYGGGWCCLLALMVHEAPRVGPHVLVQVVGWRHGRSRGVVVMMVPTTTT